MKPRISDIYFFKYFRKFFLSFVLLIAIGSLAAQSDEPDKNSVLNRYIEFLNASVHGLHVAHVMMEGYNKVVNEYVDINSHELIQISNADLPSNIFGGTDAELFFYVKSNTPESLAAYAIRESTSLNPSLAAKLNKEVAQLVDILTEINRIRFDVESFIKQHDLNDRDAIYEVYQILERAETLYKEYARKHSIVAELIYSNHEPSGDELVRSMRSVHSTMKIIYSALRKNDDLSSKRNFNQLYTHYLNFKNVMKGYDIGGSVSTLLRDINSNLNTISNELTAYEMSVEIPKRYKGYGKDYAYHNHLLKFTNTTGPGFFKHMNDLIDQLDFNTTYLDDEPIIYKVLYPMKKEEIEGLEEMERTGVSRIPDISGSSAIRLKEEKIIAEGRYIEIELYDHQMNDRDSISVEFNGVMVLENHLLTHQPYKLKLQISDQKDNVLVLHAENLGIIPPNTVAVAYRYKGQRKRVLLKSNLDVSEAIRIELEE